MNNQYLSNWLSTCVNVGRKTALSYDGRKWMPALFDTKSRKRVFKMSRQVGKSITEAAESVARCTLTENFVALHVSPSQKQSRKFSQDKVQPIINESPVLKRNIGHYNNVHERTFLRNGKLYMEYASDNPDRCRGITADMVLYDEVQDQLLDLIEGVINQVMFNSEHKLLLYAGTPKTLDNGIESNLWKNSDQREFLVRCDRHNPGRWLKLGWNNIGKHGPICHLCGGSLDVDNGVWVKTNAAGKYAGFHVNQLHCKVSHRKQEDWDVVLDTYENKPKAEFHNEVLGESYDSSEVPMSLSMLKKICDEDLSINDTPRKTFWSTSRYAGIDWGHGKAATVLTIGQFHPSKDGVYRIFFMKKYEGVQCDPDYCIPDMIKIMNRFRVSRIHTDYGGGFGLWTRLSNEYGDERVTTNYYSDSATYADMKWKTKDEEIPRLTLNRSKSMSAFINRIKKARIMLPKWSDFHPEFSTDFMNVRKEVDKKGNVKYIRIGPDDAFHACLYSFVIANYSKGVI